MPDIQWDGQASLMRVTQFDTTDETQEELIARGTLHELVGTFVEMTPGLQEGLLLRAAGPNWTQEYDTAAMRELAGRPEYTDTYGDYDGANRPVEREAAAEVGSEA